MSATPDAPDAFPVDDRRVYDAYIAGRQSAAIAAAARVGLFDALVEAEGLTLDGIAERFGWSARGARSMATALEAMGLVEPRGNRLHAAPDAAIYLTRGTPGSLHGLIDMEVDNFLSPATLLNSLKRDNSSVYGGDDPWAAHGDDPAKARAFTAAMHSVSERPAAALAQRLPLLKPSARVLDVAGGSGALSIALARRHPELEAHVWEIPAVCPLTDEYVAAAGLADRVTSSPGNMFEDPWPRGHDVLILSQILHDWSFETGAGLLASAFEALDPGAQIVIHEKLVEDGTPTPLANALVHLDMLVWTEGQQYTEQELTSALETAGFEDVQRIPTVGYWSAVIGTKPQPSPS